MFTFGWLRKLLGWPVQTSAPAGPLLAEVLARHARPAGRVTRLGVIRPDGRQVHILEPRRGSLYRAPFSPS
jgi:hypothetical protein